MRYAIGIVTIYWVLTIVQSQMDKSYLAAFIFGMVSSLVFILLFLIWWWTNRCIPRSEKFFGFLLIFAGAFLTAKLADKSLSFPDFTTRGVPLAITAATACLWAQSRGLLRTARLPAALCIMMVWSAFLVIRVDGVDSALRASLHWRWTPTAEKLFLEHPPAKAAATTNAISISPVQTSRLDWVSFRGANRDGVVYGSKLGTDWKTASPALVWKQRVGPAWSSVIVVGRRIFTQEQRGENEIVVCYDAATGNEIWAHADAGRFEEPVAGAGPRATPTYVGGQLFTLGATGTLNCLDAASGKVRWKRDIKVDSGTHPPIWGYSGSPLVVNGKVIVHAGGMTGRGLLCYEAERGELAWTAAAGDSYSSPQLTTISNVPQCLILHEGGLTAVEVERGKVLWETGVKTKSAPRCTQARLIAANRLLVGALEGAGTALVEVNRNGAQWGTSLVWNSKDMKPEFPDFVVHNGYAYGFDLSLFCCLDLSTGKRSWKEGRYGRGQVVLLADEKTLLVVSETGELILLAAEPQRHAELGRFQAVEGKTWNHPVVIGDTIFIRNASEMACYSMRSAQMASAR